MPIELNTQEIDYLQDRDFLLSKRRITDKLIALLEEVRANLRKEFQAAPLDLEEAMDVKIGKISKGENYRGLPYLVLDFPKLMEQEQILALRTMFWWGHTFSCTLHVQGDIWEKYKENVFAQSHLLEGQAVYVCVHENPWEYHFGSDNYRLWEELVDEKEILLQKYFLKLSRQCPLDSYPALSHFVLETWRLYHRLLTK